MRTGARRGTGTRFSPLKGEPVFGTGTGFRNER